MKALASGVAQDAPLDTCTAPRRSAAARRSSLVAMVVFAMAFWVCHAPLAAVSAQEKEKEESLETLDESPAADAPASGESLPSAPSAAPEPQERTLLDSLWDAGVCGLFIILCSIVALGFIIEHSMSMRKSTLMPEAVAEELETLIKEGKISEAIDACDDPHNESLIAEVVRAGLQRYQASEFGFAEYKAAVEEAGEDQTARLYRKTEVLGVIGAIAPMLGLLGTVLGMIDSFNKIAMTGGAARPDELAGGISKALVTTLMGLVVAIPTMIAFSFFRNKIDSLVAEAGKRVEQIMMPLGRRR